MMTSEPSDSKRSSRWEMRLNSMRQRLNSFWNKFALNYSKILSKYSWIILALSVLISGFLAIFCLLFVQIRSFDQNDFLLNNGESLRNARRLRQLFGNDSELRVHQQLQLYPALDLIIKRKVTSENNETNMLDEQILNEILLLDKQIQSMNYSSLCTKIDHACMIDGNYVLSETFRHSMFDLHPPEHGYYFDYSGANGIPEFMFGKGIEIINRTSNIVDYDEESDEENPHPTIFVAPKNETQVTPIISFVPLFRLRYSLKSSTPEMTQLAIEWERQVYRYLTEQFRSDLIDLSVSTSTAINDSIAKKAHEEGIFLSMMILIFFILVCIFLSLQGNSLTSVGFLPICAIISIALSTGATFGLLTLFRIQIIEPMAFLVFIIAIVDCMRCSIVCGEYHRLVREQLTRSNIVIEEILPSIIQSTHPYFLLSTLIICVAYGFLSVISPMMSSTLICSTLVLFLLVNYFIHSTFFFSCLLITLRRVVSRRHCLSCHRLPLDYGLQTERLEKCRSSMKIDSISKTFLAPILCLLSIVVLMFSLWFVLSIDTRLFIEEFLPSNGASVRSHMKSQMEDFQIGPMVIFTLPQPLNYSDPQIRSSMENLLKQCRNEPRINAFELFWLDHENLQSIIHGNESLTFRVTPFSRNDLIVDQNENQSMIVASRFYCQYKSIQGDREDIRTMNSINSFTKRSSLPEVFAFSLIFPTYESLSQIRVEILLIVLLVIVFALIFTYHSFLRLKLSLSIGFHLLLVFSSTFACLSQFDNLTWNFANSLWLIVVPICFIETFIHRSFAIEPSTWKYNRVLISLIASLLILYVYPIESYVFQIIRNSLIYQSLISLVVINVFLPAAHDLLLKRKTSEEINSSIQLTANIVDGNQSLTNPNESVQKPVSIIVTRDSF